MLSVSWEKEKAAAIVLWHPLLHQPYEEIVEEKNEFGIPVKVKKLKVCPYDPNYDPDQAWEDVKRLLNCEKPKILHNANYDSKVVWKKGFDIKNIQWCDMLAEHALEEDKRGQYRLKFLVKQFLPRYYGYEDKLQDALEEEEGTGQTESIEAEQEEKKTEVAVPEIVQNALKLLKLSPKFQTAPLLKKIEKWKESPDKYTQEISAGELLIKAKLSGEFKTSQTEKKKNNRKLKDDGGFEKIPLHIITFYACVDADVTRQLALIQKDRMIEEQIRIEEKRNKVERQLQYQRFKNKTTQVNRLCRDSENQPVKQPIISLVKERYIPRMRELAKVEFNGVTVDRKYLEDIYALVS
jgi:DNA polymerase I-like protein with 3'-5' exonuclease and polymerase domains